MAVQFDIDVSGPPAVRGGRPAFPEPIPLVRPRVPTEDGLPTRIQEILGSGMLTNGANVRELEQRVAEYLHVEHCVAVSSCTAGLMLVLQAMGVTGEVIVPSFTFSATVHSVVWNGLRPVFADIDPENLTLSPEAVTKAIGPETSAILAVHVYGTPCAVEELADIAHAHDLRLIFDAAHAFGSRRQAVPIGSFGDAEVFSLSPTKVLVAGEGGLITTNDSALAERCRIGRDYGNPGNYDCVFVGLNARMSEVHAAIALASLTEIEEQVTRRNRLAESYRKALEDLPGISFPRISEGDRSTHKDFTLRVDGRGFGMTAAELGVALKAEGIDTRRYYTPLVHEMEAYASFNGNHNLPASEEAAGRVLTLPMWSDMTEGHTGRIGAAVRRIWAVLGTGQK
ncbi:MAG: DegT/DnrJ/EryC1/StrS family aminotransferase [Actinomycetota bacterium]